MKHFFSTLLLLSFWAFLSAQVPQSMSYQAVARDAQGNCLMNQTISLQISILADSTGGDILYMEQYLGNVHTNAVGHFQIEIGAGNVQTAGEYLNFNEIPWNNQKRFLKVEFAPEGSFVFVEVGITELLTVPYAMVAGNGKRLSGTNNEEYMYFYGANGSANVVIGGQGSSGNYNDGIIYLRDGEGNNKATIESEPTADGSYGRIRTWGPNGKLNVELTATNLNDGVVNCRDGDGGTKTEMRSSPHTDGSYGLIRTWGPNGTANVELTVSSSSNLNRGAVKVKDENDDVKCNIYINSAGQGIKSFVTPHPEDSTKDIYYACIEGPEAAAYERGTAILVNGEVEVFFSETFEIVANPATMTVMTSPWSAESLGLAVVERTEKGFKVKELGGGMGNYKFDWEVKAVRKGCEDFEVVRDKDRSESSVIDETSQNED